MKNLIFGLSMALFMSACATGPTAYGPVGPDASVGFKEMRIEQDRFRVSFTGRNATEANDYALLRAAEIALQEGYSHFKIVDGGLSGDERRASPVSTSVGIGLGSGRGYYGRGTRTNVGIGIGIHDLGRALNGERVTQTFEVLLRRSGGEDPNIYNAASVQDSIRPPVFQ